MTKHPHRSGNPALRAAAERRRVRPTNERRRGNPTAAVIFACMTILSVVVAAALLS